MIKQCLEKHLSDALKKELAIFPKPSRQLRNRLVVSTPQRTKKIVRNAAVGIVSIAIVLIFICVGQQDKPQIVDNYFKPTKVIDLNELSFEPTKIVKVEN
jgi:hypothetical protein